MKEILIIGNADAIAGKGLGAAIDAHEFILRFNDYELTPGICQDYGTRTTHHAFCWEKREHAKQGPIRLTCIAPHEHHNLPVKSGLVQIEGGPVFVIARDFVIAAARDARLPEGRHATTGLVMVSWALRHGVNPILCNFDGFQSRHYYPGWTGWEENGVKNFHSADLELRYYEELAESGRLEFLR